MKILLTALLLAAPGARAQSAVFPAAEVESIEIAAERGLVELRDGWESVSVETVDADEARCLVSVRREGATVRVEARARGWRSGACPAGFRVSVPPGTPVRVALGRRPAERREAPAAEEARKLSLGSYL